MTFTIYFLFALSVVILSVLVGSRVSKESSDINDFLGSHKQFFGLGEGYRKFRELSPKIVCVDGFSMRVQVSSGHYCFPRLDDSPCYGMAEIGYPSSWMDGSLEEYAEEWDKQTDTIYCYVPVKLINAIIESHGGISHEDIRPASR